MAQLVVRFVRDEEVESSNLSTPTKFLTREASFILGISRVEPALTRVFGEAGLFSPTKEIAEIEK